MTQEPSHDRANAVWATVLVLTIGIAIGIIFITLASRYTWLDAWPSQVDSSIVEELEAPE